MNRKLIVIPGLLAAAAAVPAVDASAAETGLLLKQIDPAAILIAQEVEPVGEDETSQLREQIRALEERQAALEQELEALRQLLEAQAESGAVADADEDEAETAVAEAERQAGIEANFSVVSFQPRTSNLEDFAIVDPGTALVVGGAPATLDYRQTESFRYGANLRFEDSAVDIGFSYVTSASDAERSVESPAGGFLFATLANPAQNEQASTASAESDIRLSVTDFEVGYRFDVGDAVDARLFTGLRLADISQDATVRYDGIDFTNTEISISRGFSGTGVSLGGQADWNIGSGFSLFGRATGGLLLGEVRSSLLEVDNNGLDEVASLNQGGTSRIVPMVELAAGVNWRGSITDDFHLRLGAGYQLENWFRVLDTLRYVDSSGSGVITQESGDLTSEGWFLELGLQFDF